MQSHSRLTMSFACFGLAVGLVAGSHSSAKADVIFGATTNLGPSINTSHNDGTPFISHDGLSLYFASTRPGGVGVHDLWVATRASIRDEWLEPVHLGAAVNSTAQDYGPSVSEDGLTLCFRSTRSSGYGQGDIWVSRRSSKDAPWPAAMNAGPGINTSSDECMPFISADGLELYFGSTRLGGTGADDLYVATRPTSSAPWSTPVNLGPAVNSPAVDACPSISLDGLTLFFNSTRSSGFGNYDLYVTTRPSREAPWSPAVNLGATINTADDEMTPSIWGEGSAIYFCSWAEDRPGASGGADLWRAAIDPVIDFNGDGQVNGVEVCTMADRWGTDDSLCDIGPMPWGDGIVDLQDLIVLAEYMGEELNDPTLAAHWALDETEGQTTHDSLTATDGTVMGDAVWRPGAGMVDGALELDGVDDFVATDLILHPEDGPFSLFVWIKGGAAGQVVVSQANARVGRFDRPGCSWLAIDPVLGTLTTDLASSQFIPLGSEVVITDGQWHRVGLVWDMSSDTSVLYVDDVEVAGDAHPMLPKTYGGLQIGAGKQLAPGTFFTGLIDDVRIYNRAVKP